MSENIVEMNENKKLDVRDAARIANNYLKSFYPNVKGVQLEEVEISDDRLFWYITLSFLDPAEEPYAPFAIPKLYKIFKIDGVNGEVLSMKIRELTN